VDPPQLPAAERWRIWRERLLGFGFLAAVAGLLASAGSLAPELQGILWATLLLALVIVMRLGLLPLFGPVLVFDLIRTTRRGRYTVLRALYAAGLFLSLFAMYRNQDWMNRGTFTSTLSMARLAESFVYTFLAVQFIAVAVLTPAYVSGAIAEEKDRKTLEFLLATELRDREIVLGKFVSRLANLGLILLAGLPILSLTQLWGGVDFGMLLYFFASTVATAFCLGGISLLCSVHSQRARDAIVLTYLTVAGFVGVTVLVQLVLLIPRAPTMVVIPGSNPVLLRDVVELVNCGNPALASYGLYEDVRGGMAMQSSVATRMTRYINFQLFIAVGAVLWSIARLRSQALQDTHARTQPSAHKHRAWWRPRVGRHAMLWKEIWAEPGLTFNSFGKMIVVLIVLCSFVPAVWLIVALLIDMNQRGYQEHVLWESLGLSVNIWVRVVGTIVASLLLLGVAVRAASAIGGERDRETLDSLLTSPLDSTEILYAKFLGALLSVRWAALWLAVVWIIGGVTGGMYVMTIPWLLLSWLVYAAFLAVLGLWFSMRCRTSLRATIWTLVTSAALVLGHWYGWLLICLPLHLTGDTFDLLLQFEQNALTPPVALAWLAFRSDDVATGWFGTRNEDPLVMFSFLLFGLVLWGSAAGLLWRVAARRFRVLACRVPVPVPTSPPPEPVPTTIKAPVNEPIPASPRRRWSWKVRLGLIATAVVLAIILWVEWKSVEAEQTLTSALNETNARDENWTLDGIENNRANVPDAQNSVYTIKATRGLIGRDWKVSELAGDVPSKYPPERRLRHEQYRAVIDALEDVEEALEEVKPLAEQPSGRYPIAYSRDFIGTMLPHVDNWNSVRPLLTLEVLLRTEEGNSDEAMTACRRLLNLGRIFGDEPLLISQNLRNASNKDMLKLLERVLAQGEPSEKSLAELQAELEAEEKHNGLLIGMRGERAGCDRFLRLVEKEHLPDFVLLRAMGDEPSSQFRMEQIVYSLTPEASKLSRAAFLRHSNRMIEIAELPPEEQGPDLDQLSAEHDELPLLARLLVPRETRISQSFRETKGLIRCAIVALASERFRKKTGHWPDNAEELVTAGYLKAIPRDVFGDGPVRYARIEGGVEISSSQPILKTGTQRNGAASEIKAPCFRLFDVDRRRQEPLPD
jgi:ABC-type transport system involved in multi-copper enzyme maturation permease subunit